ncbi:MAG TPA: hypothetical protein VNK82_01315 [Terriglobales bacterium]|nr:hypothetical protein [Terriglobales bacterium]
MRPSSSAREAARLIVAGRRHPLLAAVWGALRGAVAATLDALRRLGLEIAGFFFVVFAIFGMGAGWREYQAYRETGIGEMRLAVTAAFVIAFLWFGVSSFLRARRKD